jgi:hypothetical protein
MPRTTRWNHPKPTRRGPFPLPDRRNSGNRFSFRQVHLPTIRSLKHIYCRTVAPACRRAARALRQAKYRCLGRCGSPRKRCRKVHYSCGKRCHEIHYLHRQKVSRSPLLARPKCPQADWSEHSAGPSSDARDHAPCLRPTPRSPAKAPAAEGRPKGARGRRRRRFARGPHSRGFAREAPAPDPARRLVPRRSGPTCAGASRAHFVAARAVPHVACPCRAGSAAERYPSPRQSRA